MSICFSKKKLVRSIWHNWSKKLNLVKTYFFLFLFNCHDLIVKGQVTVFCLTHSLQGVGSDKIQYVFHKKHVFKYSTFVSTLCFEQYIFQIGSDGRLSCPFLFFHFSLFYFKLICFHSFILFLFFNPTKVFYFLSNMLEIVMEV